MSKPQLKLIHNAMTSDDGRGLDWAFRTYSPFVATLAFRILGRQDEVEDVVHDVFISAHKKLPATESEARAWLTVVTSRISRRKLKMRRFRQWISLDDIPDNAETVDTRASPHDQALLTAVFRALDDVPVEARLAWSLRHLNGDSLEEVALACECSLATAKRRIATAQDILRKAMGHE